MLGVVVTRRRCDLAQGWGRGAIASLIASSCATVALSLGHLHRDTGNVANAELRDQSVPNPAESSCINPMLVTIKSEAKERDRAAYRECRPPSLKHFKADHEGEYGRVRDALWDVVNLRERPELALGQVGLDGLTCIANN